MNILRTAHKSGRAFALINQDRNYYLCDKTSIVIRKMKLSKKKAETLLDIHDTNFVNRAKNYLDTAQNSGLSALKLTYTPH